MLRDHFRFTGLTLAHATEDDFEDIETLVRRLFKDGEKIIGEPYTSRNDMLKRLKEGYEIYTVKDCTELVATFIVLPDDDEVKNALFFGRLAVLESRQGEGIGSAIVKAIIDYARELGREQVLLNFQQQHSWLEAYYNRLGFVQEGEAFDWKKMKIVPMRLRL